MKKDIFLDAMDEQLSKPYDQDKIVRKFEIAQWLVKNDLPKPINVVKAQTTLCNNYFGVIFGRTMYKRISKAENIVNEYHIKRRKHLKKMIKETGVDYSMEEILNCNVFGNYE